jgi:hypothetical protein
MNHRAKLKLLTATILATLPAFDGEPKQVKLRVEKLEDVEEPLRPYYMKSKVKEGDTEREVYEINADGLPAIRESLARNNRENATNRKLLQKVRDLGVEIDDLPTMLKDLEELRKVSGKDEEKINAIKQQLIEANKKELDKMTAKEKRLTAALERAMIDAEATAALAAEKGSVELLLPHVKSCVRLVATDDGFRVAVVDASGNERLTGTNGEPMTIKQLVAEMKSKEQFGRAFEGSGASGSGMHGGSSSGGAAKQRSKMSVEEKSKFIAEHGQAAYLALPY